MGTDIHGVVQVRPKRAQADAGVRPWTTVDLLHDSRNYPLFAVLSGLRNRWSLPTIEGVKRGLPRGFRAPGNVHAIPWLEGRVWMGDHSYGWIKLNHLTGWWGWDHMIELEGETISIRELVRRWDQSFEPWLEYQRRKWLMHRPHMEARVVFGFDN